MAANVFKYLGAQTYYIRTLAQTKLVLKGK